MYHQSIPYMQVLPVVTFAL